MKPHHKDSFLTIHKIICGPYDNNAYILCCPNSNEGILIDTPAEPDVLIALASTIDIKAILITHNHMDHLMGFAQVTEIIKAPVGMGEQDSKYLDFIPNFYTNNGYEITVGDLVLKSIFTPGHTDGSTCFTVGKHLFTGDTLFPGGPGKTQSSENLDQIIKSIENELLTLPSDTIFYPGHGDDGNLSDSLEDFKIYKSKKHDLSKFGDIQWLND